MVRRYLTKQIHDKVVYGWFDGEECFYIGMGSIERAYCKSNRNHLCISRMKKSIKKDTFNVSIFHTGLNIEYAYFLERSYIKSIGRIIDGTGKLTNFDEGGKGSFYYRKNSGQRKFRSKEYKQLCSERMKNYWRRWRKGEVDHKFLKGNKHPLFEKGHTQITKRKISENSKKLIHTEETKRKISESMKGKNNHFYGKKHTKETIEKLRQKSKSKKVQTPKGLFNSLAAAGRYYNTSYVTIRERCKSKSNKFTGYYFIN